MANVNYETAIHYHNNCISHLKQLSNDPERIMDEDLLAAAIILRFYEEVDGAWRLPLLCFY